MGCCANIFMHIWIWIKMAIVSTKYMFLECCVKLKRMAGKSAMYSSKLRWNQMQFRFSWLYLVLVDFQGIIF